MREDQARVEDEGRIASQLAERILAGDPRAENAMVERYRRGLLFLLRRATGNQALAEDLSQETFRIVLERLRARPLTDPARLAGFLRGTARNLAAAESRKGHRRRTEDTDQAEAFSDPAPSQLQAVLKEEELELVRRLVHELEPARYRQLLLRYYLAEEPKERICNDLGLDSLHFNRVLFRARQRLKKMLENHTRRQALRVVSS